MKAVVRVMTTLMVLLAGLAVRAGDGGGNGCRQRRQIIAGRAERAPVIDGRLDDPAWQLAPPATGMIQGYPDPGKPASLGAEIRALYDDRALYIFARLDDPRPDLILAPVTRRDRWVEADWFEVDIDSRNDRRNGYFFAVNAAGVQMDGLWFDDSEQSEDWDGVWASAVRITSRGWNVEMRIPLHLLRFESAPEVSFGIQFKRRVARLNEWDHWQYIPPDSGRWVSCFGRLSGLDLAAVNTYHLDLAPYLVLRRAFDPAADGDTSTGSFDAGADARLKLGSDFMLTLTANPDFGQVEVDQVVLNLSTIETYFPEKRPFFLEDMTLFQLPRFGDMNPAELFYTRRIGRAPREPELADGEELVYQPATTRIWGAAKLAGNLGRLSLGLLQAVTGAAHSRVRRTDGSEEDRLAEPLTSYSILRLRQAFLHHSTVGLMLTSVATAGEGAAVTGAGDLQLELFDQQYQLTLEPLFSYLSPARVEWHDDFTRAAVDEDGPWGYGGTLIFRKVGGEHLVGAVMASWRSPNLALNDLGYLDRPDVFSTVLWLQYRRLKPLGPLDRFNINLATWMWRNTDFLNLGDGVNMNGEVQFTNGWFAGIDGGLRPGSCDDRETRSEGRVALCRRSWLWDTGLWVGSDQRRALAAVFMLGFDETEHGYNLHTRMEIGIKPLPRLQLDLMPGYLWETGRIRWLDTWDTTEGERYLFARRHIEYWDVTLRGTYTFTTTLTLQAYAQVFLASVDYGGKLAAPPPAGSRVYTDELVAAPDVDDEYDFTDSALNLSVVLRWEYLPGSLLYLVYTGSFGDDDERADFRFGPLLGDLLATSGQHVLMLKLSYLWG